MTLCAHCHAMYADTPDGIRRHQIINGHRPYRKE